MTRKDQKVRRDHKEEYFEKFFFALFAIFVIFARDQAFAVGTSHWTHTSEADFKAGTLHNVVPTNLGDLKLSRAVKTILEQDPRISSVYAIVQSKDGTIYAATGPQGVLLQIKDDKVTDAAKLEDGTSIFSLAIDKDGAILIGTGGENGKILKLAKAGEKPKEIFAHEKVQYVWCLTQTADGNVYAGTGPEGQLFEIRPDGTNTVMFDSDENNLLCMASDGKDLLYIGTDPNGLVYRVNRKTKETYVAHDAAESEVSAIVLDGKGNIFAATGEAMSEAEAAAPEAEKGGRPEGGTGGVPIPSQPPKEPKPPTLPDPSPGEPDPIPKEPKKQVSMMFAADTGESATSPTTAPSPATPALPGQPSMAEAGKPRAGGNAIYKIDSNGLVTEIFRQPVLVLSMIEQDGNLLVGTGSEGLVYQINPTAEETIVLAKVDPKQIMCLTAASDGRVLMGMANTGGIAAMTSGFAAEGTYISDVLDAAQISRFGKMQLHGSLPPDTSLKVSTRSGNVSEPSDVGWSKWSEPASASEFVTVTSEPARFLQYRFTFTSAAGKTSPVVDEVSIAYQVPNLAPEVKSVKITSASAELSAAVNDATPAEQRHQTISFEASDPNNDAMVYSIHYRTGSKSPWILLKDKLKETTYEWDTKGVADGRYEIKVSASDESANPVGAGKTSSRVSDPFTVDNTAPVIGDLKETTTGKDAKIEFTAADRTGTLASFAYRVDSGEDWQAVLPSDNICDGPEEKVSFTIPGLASGAHQIAVRATDEKGNQALQTINVTIEPDAKK